MNTVIVPLDGPASERALPTAIRLAAKLDARILVVHVSQSMIAPCGPAPLRADEPDRVARLHQVVADLRAEGVPASLELRTTTFSAPAGIIAELARRRRAAAIVVASRARAGVFDAITGGVSRRLLRMAPCPVVVVTPQTVAETSQPVASGALAA